jgi:hypothetical protein
MTNTAGVLPQTEAWEKIFFPCCAYSFVRNTKWGQMLSHRQMEVKAVKKVCVGGDAIHAGVCAHLLYGKSLCKWWQCPHSSLLWPYPIPLQPYVCSCFCVDGDSGCTADCPACGFVHHECLYRYSIGPVRLNVETWKYNTSTLSLNTSL